MYLGLDITKATAHANAVADRISSVLREEYVLGEIRHRGSASIGIKHY